MSPNLTLYQADHGLFILAKMGLYVLCGVQYAQTIPIIWMRARGRCLEPFSATFHLIPYFHLIIVTGSSYLYSPHHWMYKCVNCHAWLFTWILVIQIHVLMLTKQVLLAVDPTKPIFFQNILNYNFQIAVKVYIY